MITISDIFQKKKRPTIARVINTGNSYFDFIINMSEFEPTTIGRHTTMLESLVVEILVVAAWIVFVAYGAWFFSSARKREREQAEVRERKGKKQERISERVFAPEQVRKSIPQPLKKPEKVRAYARSRSYFVSGLAVGFGLTFLAAFVILWISIFYASQLSVGISYEKMIVAFIFPMLFIFATGTVLLTIGIVRWRKLRF